MRTLRLSARVWERAVGIGIVDEGNSRFCDKICDLHISITYVRIFVIASAIRTYLFLLWEEIAWSIVCLSHGT